MSEQFEDEDRNAIERVTLLADLSCELDTWLSGAKEIPATVHNRAVRNAVSVVADAVAITRARFEARQSDATRAANATAHVRDRSEAEGT